MLTYPIDRYCEKLGWAAFLETAAPRRWITANMREFPEPRKPVVCEGTSLGKSVGHMTRQEFEEWVNDR